MIQERWNPIYLLSFFVSFVENNSFAIVRVIIILILVLKIIFYCFDFVPLDVQKFLYATLLIRRLLRDRQAPDLVLPAIELVLFNVLKVHLFRCSLFVRLVRPLG